MNKMAAGIVLTCLGTPFFHAGEEFGRTKCGCHNSYNQSAMLNQLDWQRARGYHDLVDYYRFMIELRKSFPVFDNKTISSLDAIHFLSCEDAIVGFTMYSEKTILIYYNPYNRKKTVTLPEGSWYLLSDGVSRWDMHGICDARGLAALLPKSVTVLKEK